MQELQQVKWGEFRIGDLFEKLNLKFLKSTFDKEKDISKEKTKEFNLPLVNAKNGDNGVMYYGRSSDFESVEMTIDIVNDGAVSTGNVYPQPQRTGVLYNAYLIKSKFKVNERLLYFFASTIQKSIKLKFGYENKAGWAKVKEEKISLPTKNGEIDFDFMENFISQLEAFRLSQLEAYLLVTGLKDYTLMFAEQQALADFENGKVQWGEFRIGDLFDIQTSKKRFDANKVTILEIGRYPYVVRTALNNGIKGYIEEDTQFLNEGNTISFGQDTATVFYQEKPYFTGDKIKIIKPKNNFLSRINAQFILAMMAKSFAKFSWGSSSFKVAILENVIIQLPTKNGEIDFDFMETLISAIQKLVIKDVVLYADKKIAATKQAMGKG
ncbi:restriction endonuclease subunit S [Moraxella catarrhalis]|uniref:restriction endonuclease subunit S n=2 Tax=Moraxella catarrhalis TaxID=480 RepID=UPI0007E2FC11|nr:restriction endonuclease subunit S [Moraxella catarrhalis]MPX28709.1 restriction endonuclease [Moraxella catarrhalis]RKL87761.1 restriction endonuclease subunit S [Moraxella catarrhalis]RKL89136.1 restriction endonuclease subunit S [Moraxella catarrhalis]RKL99955.1 restriction endonuclease subunit S [Moraxella catarrhalis]